MPAEAPTIVAPPPGPSPETAAARAAQTTINVSALPKSAEPARPPKPGSARAKLFESMDKKFGGEQSPTAPPVSAPKAETPAAAVPRSKAGTNTETPDHPAPESTGGSPNPPPGEAAEATTTPPAATPGGPQDKTGKKVSPWKMVDEWKDRATKAEARILDLQKQIVPEEQARQAAETVKQLETRIKEMTEDLRYVRAEKYDPDVLKATEDYTRTFNRAMSELKDLVVTDPQTQQPRALTVNDIAELAFMPLGQAQQVAKEVFGDLAPYVMDHRNEIRRMWDAKQAILENLKKTGADREKQRTQELERSNLELSGFIEQTFKAANEEAVNDPTHGRFFKPIEGDDEWNTRLEKGFATVDEAFARNVSDPSLTKEQRTDIVRRHAAIRNMAAAFRPLRYKLEQTEKQLADALKELEQYKDTTPATGGRVAPPAAEKPRGMAGLFSELDKLAH